MTRRDAKRGGAIRSGGWAWVWALASAAGIAFLFFNVHYTPSPPADGDGYGALAFGAKGLEQAPGRGIRVDVAIDAQVGGWDGCDQPVEVRAVFSGTREFWRGAGKRLPDPSTVAIGVSGNIDGLDFGFAGEGTDPLEPQYARPLEISALADPRDEVRLVPVAGGKRQGGQAVLHRWSRTWVPLVASFQADWLSERTLGTCYLRLPSLTSNAPGAPYQSVYLMLEALRSGGKPSYTAVRRTLPATAGVVEVRVGGGSVQSRDSSPSPSSVSAEAFEPTAGWACRATEPAAVSARTGLPLSPNRRVAALPVEAVEAASGCGGFAVIATAWAEPVREAGLVVLGLLIGSFTTAVTVILRRSRRQSPRED